MWHEPEQWNSTVNFVLIFFKANKDLSMVSENPETCCHLSHPIYRKGNNPAVNYSDKFTMPLLLKVIKLVRLYCLINSYILFWMVCCGSFISGRSVVSSMDPGTCMCACAHTHTKTLLGDEEGGKDTVQQSEAIQLATALYTEHVLAICNCIQISLSHVKWYTLSSECTLFVTHTIGKLDILLQEYFYINWCQAWNLLQCVYGK